MIKYGLKVGKNFKRLNGVTMDWSHCWLITIGDDVTLAPGVRLIAHDASTKNHLGYTKIGKIHIGDNVFIGAASVVLPNVKIGSNVIIGANSTVTHDIPNNCVAVGCPARVICSTDEYLAKEKQRMENAHVYDESYIIHHITPEKKAKMIDEIDGIAYIV